MDKENVFNVENIITYLVLPIHWPTNKLLYVPNDMQTYYYSIHLLLTNLICIYSNLQKPTYMLNESALNKLFSIFCITISVESASSNLWWDESTNLFHTTKWQTKWIKEISILLTKVGFSLGSATYIWTRVEWSTKVLLHYVFTSISETE